MSKTLSKTKTHGGGGSSFAKTSSNSSDYSLNLSSEEDDLKVIEQQLAAENGLTVASSNSSGQNYDVSVASKSASEMTAEELEIAQEALRKREMTIGEKTTQNGAISINDADGKRLDAVSEGKSKEVAELGGTITGEKDGKVKYEGELGSFTYDPKEWALAIKEVKDDASGVTTTIPVLRYIAEDNSKDKGDQVYGGNITIPDGLKSLDYSFENNKALETIPAIPDSVESAHAAFKNCTKVTRAAKNAKENEADGNEHVGTGAAIGTGVGLAGGALAGLKIGAAAGTAVTPGIGTAIGAVGGAIVGLAGGAIGGKIAGKDNDGKGGTWDMPDGLKDASEMFSGCENLTEAYDAAGENLINARSMYEGTKKLGTDEIANKFGSVAITDFNSDSKLSKEAVQDSFTGTNVELTDELKGNYSKDWDEESQTMNKADITAEEKKEVEDLNQTLQEHDAVFGEVNNDMTAQTDGLASSATVTTEHGIRSTTDVTETNANSSSGTEMGNLLDRGLVSLGEFWILKKVTGNSLIAGVATFGLQAVGILPKSMKPILNAVTGFVGEDSAIGKALSGFADKLPGETESEQGKTSAEKNLSQAELAQDKAEKDSSDKTNSTVDERVKSDMNSMRVAVNSDKVVDVSSSMEANGKSVAKDGVLLTAANKKADDSEFQAVQTMSMTMAAGLEEKAVTMAGESGKLSDEDKKTLASQCLNIMKGMDAYDNGALAQIKTSYGEGTAKSQQATQGLEKVMSASTLPFMDAIKDMDAKYEFLSDTDKKYLNTLEVTGVGSYESYQVGSLQTSSSSKQTVVEEDMSMYANAGLNDEITVSPTKATGTKVLKTTNAPVVQTNVVSVESRTAKTSESANKTTNRTAELDAKFGHILEQESSSDYDYC